MDSRMEPAQEPHSELEFRPLKQMEDEPLLQAEKYRNFPPLSTMIEGKGTRREQIGKMEGMVKWRELANE